MLRSCSASVSPSYAFLLGLVERPPPLMALAKPPPPGVLLGSVAKPDMIASWGCSGSSSQAFLLGRVARPFLLIALTRPLKFVFFVSSLILRTPTHGRQRQKWLLSTVRVAVNTGDACNVPGSFDRYPRNYTCHATEDCSFN